jgi:hypothetical protein
MPIITTFSVSSCKVILCCGLILLSLRSWTVHKIRIFNATPEDQLHNPSANIPQIKSFHLRQQTVRTGVLRSASALWTVLTVSSMSTAVAGNGDKSVFRNPTTVRQMQTKSSPPRQWARRRNCPVPRRRNRQQLRTEARLRCGILRHTLTTLTARTESAPRSARAPLPTYTAIQWGKV